VLQEWNNHHYFHVVVVQFGGRAFCMTSLAADEMESGKRMSNSTIRSPRVPPFGFGKPHLIMCEINNGWGMISLILIYRCVLPG
jgi:hypothetical protein